MDGIRPIDPALARDLAAAAARSPRSTWCITVTGPDHRPVAHGCGRPPPRRDKRGAAARDGPLYTPAMNTARPGRAPSGWTSPPSPGQPGQPAQRRRRRGRGGGAGVRAGEPGRAVRSPAPGGGPRPGGPAAAPDRDPERLLHLPALPPPAGPCDYEHSTAYEKGGRTCLCDAGPVCRRNHRDKQAPGWRLEHAGTRGWFRWTTPSGRTYLSRPTQYPD